MLFQLIVLLTVSFNMGAVHAWSVRPAPPERVSLLSGYAATLTALSFRKTLLADFQTYEATRKPLGPSAKIGDYAGQVVPNALYAGGMWLAYAAGNAAADRRAQLMVVATAEAGLTALALKAMVRERRPNGSNDASFPSGHSTTIFAFAATVQAEHGWKYGVPALALAVFTGWSRINDNMHYTHDVLAGATLGLSVGLGVALKNGSETGANVRLSPLILDDGGGLMASLPW